MGRILIAMLGWLVWGTVQAGVFTDVISPPPAYDIQMIGVVPSVPSGPPTSLPITSTTTIPTGQALGIDDIRIGTGTLDNRYATGPLVFSIDGLSVNFASASVTLYQNQNDQGIYFEGLAGTPTGTSPLLPGASNFYYGALDFRAPAEVLDLHLLFEPVAPPFGFDPLVEALLKLQPLLGGAGCITCTVPANSVGELTKASITLATDVGGLSGTIEGLTLSAVPLPAAWGLFALALGLATLGRALGRLR